MCVRIVAAVRVGGASWRGSAATSSFGDAAETSRSGHPGRCGSDLNRQPFCLRSSLGSYTRLLARVGQDFVRLALRGYAGAVVLSHKHNLQAALHEHPGKCSLAFTDGQGLFRVVPVKRDRRVYSSLVVVAIVFIFVEREIAIRPA